MKKYLLVIIITYCTDSFAQKENTNETLDKFFAGAPLQESFESWLHYINNHPYLGVDSFNKRGIYSSFKPGIKNYFPFPDSMKIKLLFQKTVYYNSRNKPVDSVNEICIEAVFPFDKSGKKESIKVFDDLRKKLQVHYRNWDIKNYYDAQHYDFIKGKNKNFPDCILEQNYEPDLGFYYVLIWYSSPGKK